MPTPLDWLGVQPQVNQSPASWFTPAVPPRSYGLAPADAIMQMRQAMPGLQAAAQTADIMRQQQLAPLQQQVTMQQLQNQVDLQPRVFDGREEFIRAVSALNPTADNYLEERRNVVMQNPYALGDPLVQEVLRNNDRAYDDYIQTKRLEAYGAPRQISPGQRAALMKRVTDLTQQLTQQRALGADPQDIEAIANELQALDAMLQGGQPKAAAPSAQVPTAPTAPSFTQTNQLPEQQRWQKSKEYMLSAVQKMAEATKLPPYQVMLTIMADPNTSRRFYSDYLGAEPGARAMDADRWLSGDDVSWLDIFTSLLGDESMINVEGTMPEGAPPGSFRLTPK